MLELQQIAFLLFKIIAQQAQSPCNGTFLFTNIDNVKQGSLQPSPILPSRQRLIGLSLMRTGNKSTVFFFADSIFIVLFHHFTCFFCVSK